MSELREVDLNGMKLLVDSENSNDDSSVNGTRWNVPSICKLRKMR